MLEDVVWSSVKLIKLILYRYIFDKKVNKRIVEYNAYRDKLIQMRAHI